MVKTLPAGLYAPLPVFFTDDDKLDLNAYKEHAKYVAAAGVLPVASASIGEAAHLDRSERIEVIKALRDALDAIGLHKTPIVAGVGATSTRETIQLAKDAASVGADFVLVVAPGYYAGVLKSNTAAMRNFFVDVAAASPVPVIIYNYPGVAAGIDLDSDDATAISKAAPNVCGIMLSCGNVGKLSRITTLVDKSSFTTLAGFIDILLPSVAVGSMGAISPLPNIAPKFSTKLWRATQSLDTAADRQSARELQSLASLAEAAILKKGLPGLKRFLSQEYGYPAAPRLPLPLMGDEISAQLSEDKHIKTILEMEKGLK
ncbi:aldolase-type TIM barrel [Pochonia chlamydosporia 170]|uniref:Aldolase-type TIM barrel n=1 Tax=Pochonia chlamydosporia 170 TaxID=1380566 RepID=A0A179F3Y3_METCM|nr:aldolase-type TIM barrel [Pochonia chlamydosporia 170]OAQ60128.1 aldolase-type TIM barrel [Pochonia chlamydosporia 170]